MKKRSNTISLPIQSLLRFIAAHQGLSTKDTVSLAVKSYKEFYPKDTVKPAQNPLIYPQTLRYIALEESDRQYLTTLPTHCPRRMPEALDRVIIAYQNNTLGLLIPEHIRVTWLDGKYLHWMENCPTP